MEKVILFQKNANVVTASGKQLGTLERVVVNPESKVVTDIVILGGALFNKENRVVPISMVAETTEDEIVLRGEPEDLQAFPPFEEQRILEEDHVERSDTDVVVPPIIYGLPGVGMGSVILPATTEEKFATTIEQNIPEGTVAVKEGAKVFTADDKQIGIVERVLADPSIEQVTHLLIEQGLLIREHKLIPITWVLRFGEDAVHLRVKEDATASLKSTSRAD